MKRGLRVKGLTTTGLPEKIFRAAETVALKPGRFSMIDRESSACTWGVAE
jgi:hypothetical protein